MTGGGHKKESEDNDQDKIGNVCRTKIWAACESRWSQSDGQEQPSGGHANFELQV